MWIDHIWSFLSSADRHSGCSHLFTIVNAVLAFFRSAKGPLLCHSHLFIQELVTALFFFFFGSMQKNHSSPVRDQTSSPCIGSPESKPLVPQGNPKSMVYFEHFIYALLLLSIFLSFFSLFYKISLSYAILPHNKDVNNVTKLLLFSFLITD